MNYIDKYNNKLYYWFMKYANNDKSSNILPLKTLTIY